MLTQIVGDAPTNNCIRAGLNMSAKIGPQPCINMTMEINLKVIAVVIRSVGALLGVWVLLDLINETDDM